MKPIREWNWGQRWAAIVTVAGGIAVIGEAAGVVQAFEWALPAHRGLVAEEAAARTDAIALEAAAREAAVKRISDDIEDRATKRDAEMKALSDQAAAALGQARELVVAQNDTQHTLQLVMQQQYEIQGSIFEGQLRALRAELVDLQVHLKDAPGDTLLLGRQSEVLDTIVEVTRRKTAAECDLSKMRGFARSC